MMPWRQCLCQLWNPYYKNLHYCAKLGRADIDANDRLPVTNYIDIYNNICTKALGILNHACAARLTKSDIPYLKHTR